MRMLPPTWGPAEVDGLRCVVVPSGIGEFQWAWTKYVNTGERFAIFALDGTPRRIHQFCEMHPQIEAFSWAGYDYTTIRRFQDYHELTSWDAVRAKFGPGQLVMLACNPHLEAGRPLAEWMPDLPTTYRYSLDLTRYMPRAEQYLQTAEPDDMLIGISCASYRGASSWRTWETPQWLDFLRSLQKEVPNARFVLLGGAWDDLTAAMFDDGQDLRWLCDPRGIPPVGRTSFGVACGILSRIHAYIGFSSGLGHVAAHNCGTPVFMLWPDHEYEYLSRSWVDPELLESGRYVPSQWLEPAVVVKRVQTWLQTVTEG